MDTIHVVSVMVKEREKLYLHPPLYLHGRLWGQFHLCIHVVYIVGGVMVDLQEAKLRYKM